jgi:hypothetical protein
MHKNYIKEFMEDNHIEEEKPFRIRDVEDDKNFNMFDLNNNNASINQFVFINEKVYVYNQIGITNPMFNILFGLLNGTYKIVATLKELTLGECVFIDRHLSMTMYFTSLVTGKVYHDELLFEASQEELNGKFTIEDFTDNMTVPEYIKYKYKQFMGDEDED